MAALDGTVKVPGLGDVKKKYLAGAAVFVAAAFGYGYYRKRQAAAAAPVVDTGTGAVDSNAFGDTTPVGPGGSNGVTNQFGDPVAPPIVQQQPGIDTNLDWLTAAQAVDLGIPSDSVTAALRNVLGGTPVTQPQADIFHQVVGVIGNPPQGFPPIRLTSTPTTPPPSTGGTTTHWIYDVQTHQLSKTTGARALVQRFSDAGASANQIETALRATVNDHRNARYLAFYSSHGGEWPAKALIYTTVVKKVGTAA